MYVSHLETTAQSQRDWPLLCSHSDTMKKNQNHMDTLGTQGHDLQSCSSKQPWLNFLRLKESQNKSILESFFWSQGETIISSLQISEVNEMYMAPGLTWLGEFAGTWMLQVPVKRQQILWAHVARKLWTQLVCVFTLSPYNTKTLCWDSVSQWHTKEKENLWPDIRLK